MNMRDATFFDRYLYYNPETGEFKYKPRGVDEFPSNREFNRWNSRYAGKPAGGYSVRRDGYRMLRIRVCWGRYVASRIAGVLCGMLTDYHDQRQIDHIDGNPENNKSDNLRPVDNWINSRNRSKRLDNTSGVTGVKKTYKSSWGAFISYGGKQVYLGQFDNFFDAVCARRSAELSGGYTRRHGK